MNQEVTILILTHKSKKLVLDYIKELYKKFKIIIIDNSNDLDLKSIIINSYPGVEIYLIPNNGYSNQINFGSKLVKTEYFLISNPDIRGMNESNVLNFVKAAKELKNKFSALGPRFLNVNPKSHKQSEDNKSISPMKFISGACMFFNKKNFDSLNGFDENIFLYFEENDFCIRSYKVNKNYQLNNIKIEHDIGTSVEVKNEEDKINQANFRTWHFIWSKFYYYKKHYGFFLAIIYFLPIIIRINFRIVLYKYKNDKINLTKYINRRSGLYSSILNKQSSKRI
ncbi:glycosyltransferase family 2 protein [Candidatus Pelagibacter sp. HIMB1587]|uniref:glycosyltransferase family 2 protein n=1 Tax=Candidatus Pelagibacter sp. HIMB1587 TaxID=3413354 RepID=UPI003F834830